MSKSAQYLLIVFCLLGNHSISYSNEAVQAVVDRTQISEGEPLTLTLRVQNSNVQDSPDIKDLSKDFHVHSTFQSKKISIINGKTNTVIEWKFILIPLSKGKLTIPSLNIGKLQTKPINIEVEENSNGSKKNVSHMKSPKAYIEASVDVADPVVQSQVIYTVKLYHIINLIKGSMTEPSVKDAIVLPMGNEKHYLEEKNGYQYEVVERKYVIFPQKSTRLTIESPVFEGIFEESTNDVFDSFFHMDIRGKPIRAKAPSISLEVKPAPEMNNLIHWLPAKRLDLTENWKMPETLKVGQPIVRNITVRVQGLTAEQLPKIQYPKIEGIQFYEDTPKLDNIIESEFVLGQRVETITYIPVKPGRFFIPSITVQWWDIHNKKLNMVTLPEKILDIAPGQDQIPENQFSQNSPIVSQEDNAIITDNLPKEKNIWVYAAWLFVALWLGTVIAWLLSKRKNNINNAIANVGDSKKEPSEKELKKNILAACKSNNPYFAKKAILRWAKKIWKDSAPQTLQAMSEEVDEPLRSALKTLDEIIYNEGGEDWNGEQLKNAMQNFSFKTSRKSEIKSPLPPLYPE